MRRILRFLIFLFGLQGAILALAQTPVPLPVQGNLGSISGSGVPYAGIDIQLQNCPSPVSITGYWGIIQQEYQVMADPSGNINTTVWPNDLITCNGTTGNSQYNLSLILNGVVQGTPQCYQVVSTQGFWNLTTQQPIACSQPAPNPQDKTFNNLTVNGFFQGHNGAFSGTLDVGSMNMPGKVCNAAFYGALGNGSANDHDAIQTAFDTCYITGGSVYFPTNFSNVTGTTVYYTATAINPKGVSMFGPPGASGPQASYLNQSAVAIRGGVGQDVFDTVDPTNGAYVVPRSSFTVQDLAVFVDDSLDSQTSFPNRLPARVCSDVVANGTAVITSAAQCEFQPGDVGQAIGLPSNSGTIVTTILSWQSANQVTLNATALVSSTGAQIFPMGLPITARVGNCAFAYDDQEGTGVNVEKSVYRNVIVRTTTGSTTGNSTCGFFYQANTGPTKTRWEDVSVAGTGYGFAYVPVFDEAPSSSIYTGIADENVWDNLFIAATYPFLAYSGEQQDIRQMQINGQNGLQIIDAYGTVSHSSQWKIDLPEEEAAFGGCAGSSSFRIAGLDHTISRMNIGLCPNSTIQWDARDSTVSGLGVGAYAATLNITGNLNTFDIPDGADLLYSHLTPVVTGYGNTIKTGTNWNPLAGVQPARIQYANPGISGLATSPLGTPNLSRGSIYLNRTSDFIRNGGDSYYFNDEDMWLWPQEVQDTAGGGTTNPLLTADTTSETGSSFQVNTSGRTNQYVSASNGVSLYIGSQVPAKKMRVYFKAKAASATSMTVGAQAGGTGIGSTTASLTTTPTVFSFDADATSYTGQMFILNFSSVTANAKVFWIGIKPWDSDTTTNSITLGSGVAVTGNQGNGVKMQHSTGTTTTNNCAKFDANGNIVDAGAACGSSFSSGSNANGRWVTDPTGTTTERGCISVTAGGTTHVTGAITWPQTFVTAIDSYSLTAGNSPDGGDTGTAGTSLWLTSISTSGATANYRCVTDIGGGGCAAISNTVPLCFIAIGR